MVCRSSVEICGLNVGNLMEQKAVRKLSVPHLKMQAAHLVCDYETFFSPFHKVEGNSDVNQVLNDLGRKGVLLPHNERNDSTHHVDDGLGDVAIFSQSK